MQRSESGVVDDQNPRWLNQNEEDITETINRLLFGNSWVTAKNNECFICHGNAPSIQVNRWIYTIEEGSKAEGIYPVLGKQEKPLKETSVNLVEEDAKTSWCYLSGIEQINALKNRPERLVMYHSFQYIYSMSVILSKTTEDKVMVVNNSHNPLPMKIWLNGQLVFASFLENRMRRQESIIRLNPGCNVFLVERTIEPKQKIKDRFMDSGFSIQLHDMQTLGEEEYLLPFLKDMKDAKPILRTLKVQYQVGDELSMILLEPSGTTENQYEIHLVNEQGAVCGTQWMHAGNLSSILLEEGCKGILRIEVFYHSKLVAQEYILVEEWQELKNRIQHCEDKEAVRLLHWIDLEKNVVRCSIYPLDCNVFHSVLGEIYEILSQQDTASTWDKAAGYHIHTMTTHCLGEERSYGVYLPEHYDSTKQYPLVVEYISCYGKAAIPGLNGNYQKECFQRDSFENVIVAVIPCIFEKYNPLEVLVFYEALSDLMKRYLVLENRISLIGFCGSADCCMHVIRQMQGVFSMVLLLSPYISEDVLQQWKPDPELTVKLIINPDTGLCLSGFHYQQLISECSLHITPGLSHEEVKTMYLNPDIIQLAASCERKNCARFPLLKFDCDSLGYAFPYTQECVIVMEEAVFQEIDAKERELLTKLLSELRLSNLEMKIVNHMPDLENEPELHVIELVRRMSCNAISSVEVEYGIQRNVSGTRMRIWYDSIEGLKKLYDKVKEAVNVIEFRIFQNDSEQWNSFDSQIGGIDDEI